MNASLGAASPSGAAALPSRPPIALLGVSARDRSIPRTWNIFKRSPPSTPGSIIDVRFEAGAGVTAILGGVEDGARVLADVLAGRYRPDRGSVLVGGVDPSRNAGVRRGIGFLSPEPELLPAKTVLRSVARSVSVARDGDLVAAATALLDTFGLRALQDRDVRSLSQGEARSVELALALATPTPVLVVLYEPFVDVAGISEAAVRERIATIGEKAPVIVIAASPADAQIARSVYALHRGSLARSAGTATALGAFERTELHVWVTTKGRDLARALAESPSLRGVSWEAGADLEAGGGVLRIAGPDLSEVALALADAAVATSAVVTGFARVSPTLGEIRATTEAVRYAQYAAAQAAYRDAYATQARLMEEARARSAQPNRAALFEKPGATPIASSGGTSGASPAWVPASTPPPASDAEAIAEQERKWGPKPAPAPASAPAPAASPPPSDDPPKEGS